MTRTTQGVSNLPSSYQDELVSLRTSQHDQGTSL